MSRENVEIVRQAYAAWQRGDVAAMLEDVDPEVVAYRAEPDGSTWHGIEGLMGLISDWTANFGELIVTADAFVDAGDRVIARMHQTASGQTSGVEVEADFWCVHTFKDGKMVRYEIYADKAQAFEAAGLEE